MATARADAWQQGSLRQEPPPVAARPERRPPPPLPPLPDLPGRPRPLQPVDGPGRSRLPDPGRPVDHGRSPDRAGDRSRPDRGMRPERDLRADAMRPDGERSRPPSPRRAGEPARPVSGDADRNRAAERPPSARPARNPPREGAVAPDPSNSGLRGIVAVLGIFVITLAGGLVDWFTGVGLGMITLVALVTSTAIATLVVRRRDMATVVLSPALVFVAVCGVNVALSPSLALSIPTVATLLIRGFPTMAVATAGAIILALVRLVTKR